jgi:hypothetical protein
MTTEQIETVEERAERARDLQAAALQALGAEGHRQEWVIEDASPDRKLYVLYSTVNGERIEVPRFILNQALKRLIPGTDRHAFTAHKENAPEPRRGTVKCFLHEDSPDREALHSIGIYTTCPAGNLGSQQSKRIHAQHRHQQEWAAYQEHLEDIKKQQAEARQQQTLEATLAIAGAAVGHPVETLPIPPPEMTETEVTGTIPEDPEILNALNYRPKNKLFGMWTGRTEEGDA